MKRWHLILGILMSLLLAYSASAFPGWNPRQQAEREARQSGFLGITMQEVTADLAEEHDLHKAEGIVVTHVMDGLAASEAGLDVGDLLLQWDGERIRSALQFKRLVKETPPGRTVEVELSRSGVVQTYDCTVGSRAEAMAAEDLREDEEADEEDWSWQDRLDRLREQGLPDEWTRHFEGSGLFSQGRRKLGVLVSALEPQLAAYFGVADDQVGVLVSSVQPTSSAEQAGLQAGDIILTIDEAMVTSPRDVSRLINRVASDSVQIEILRNKAPVTLQAELLDPESDEEEAEEDEDLPEIGEGAQN